VAKKTSQYKPKNPNDPKNPFANDEFFDVPSRDVEVVTKRAKPSKERSQFDLKANESNQTLELETLKSRVSSILRKNTANSNMVIDENNPASLEFLDKEERKFGEFVMPDPDSANNLKAMRTTEYKLEYKQETPRRGAPENSGAPRCDSYKTGTGRYWYHCPDLSAQRH
jgi:hypothetical protein